LKVPAARPDLALVDRLNALAKHCNGLRSAQEASSTGPERANHQVVWCVIAKYDDRNCGVGGVQFADGSKPGKMTLMQIHAYKQGIHRNPVHFRQ
jgi:hypothetical protein